jgi:DNA repair protein RadA/Sms
MYPRRAFRLRPFFVQKNRFGPDVVDPIVLNMDQQGRLVTSPLSTAKQSSVFGFSGAGEELTETQASVSVPRYGCRPELLSPFLPEKRVRQLLGVLNTVADLDLTHLNYAINCYLPGQQQYRGELDLALVVALLSSYLQQALPGDVLFAGELDLRARIRPPEHKYLRNLAAVLLGGRAVNIRRVFVAKDTALRLSSFQEGKKGPRLGDSVQVRGVTDLEDVLVELWPDLMGHPRFVCGERAG